MNRKYGVSVASMFPWSLGPWGPEQSVELALRAGYSGIQVLPLKGWSYRNIHEWSKYVISYEDAWNFGPLHKAVLRQLGYLDEPAPLLQDWLMFGREVSPAFPKAILSTHTWQIDAMVLPSTVEIHPELSSKNADYINYARSGRKLTWDTHHVRRPHRNKGYILEDWENLLTSLPESSIGLIHIHPTREELQDFLIGKGEITKMLQMLAYQTDAPAIIEVAPPFNTVSGTGEFLSELRLAAEEWLR